MKGGIVTESSVPNVDNCFWDYNRPQTITIGKGTFPNANNMVWKVNRG